MRSYYQMSGEEVLQEVNGSLEPLTNEQVREHQEQYGPNELVEGKKKTILQIFLEQYKDFLVIILIIAAVASGFMGDVESAAVILIVITMNAILGTVQTIKAEQSLASLKKLSGPEAKVLRDGAVVQIPSAEVTVGDIVMLEAGDYIPADGRLLECASMKVDESALTGESLGVEKTTTIIKEENVPLGDRVNMVYSGSFVTYGRGSFLVTEIGMETEVGKIAGLLKNTSEKRTPLQVNLDQFGQKLSILILVFCGILFGISILRGDNIGDAFLFAVALAVAAIPEALSSIVTIVLSFGTQKMAKEHAIIRKLQAVEGLGSVSVICSDKTGTLTQNKMTVEDYYVDEKSIPAGAVDLTDSSQSRLMISSIRKLEGSGEDEVRQRARRLTEMQQLVDRVDSLVVVLLKMAKLDSGTAILQKEKISIKDLILHSAEPLAISMDLHGVKLCLNGNDTNSFLGDFRWSAEAITNILKNGIEHMENGGNLCVSWRETSVYSEIVITDEGSGISDEELPHIFERFYRGKTARHSGFGIGMAMAQSIFAKQNGTIKAQNREEGGAKFVIHVCK